MGWLTLLTISILILILLIFVFLVERDRKRVQTSNRLVYFLGVIFWILYGVGIYLIGKDKTLQFYLTIFSDSENIDIIEYLGLIIVRKKILNIYSFLIFLIGFLFSILVWSTLRDKIKDFLDSFKSSNVNEIKKRYSRKKRSKMKILLYICGAISIILGIYEFFWITKSGLAFVIILLAFILAINSFTLARREK